MPYNAAQCALFAEMEARGEKPPSDWKRHCTKSEQLIAAAKAQLKKGKKK